jgi:ankyrin repeat protein
MKGNRPPCGMNVFSIARRTLAALLPCCVLGALYQAASIGARPGAPGPDALFEAIRHDDVADVERALALGTSVEATQDGTDMTPLMFAAGRGRPPLVECLLARGADVNATAVVYGTPLAVAASNGHVDVVRVLIARGADPNRCSAYGFTPLMGAARAGDAALVGLLIGAGAAVNARDAYGNTALLLAAAQGDDAIVRQLIAAGADVSARDRLGMNACEVAEAHGYPGIARVCQALKIPPASLRRAWDG